MGRELHDSTAQTLVALQLKVMHLKEALDDTRLGSELSELEQSVSDLHQEIRAISSMSSLPLLERGTLPTMLQSMADRFGELTGLKIAYRIGAYEPCSVALESCLYRIAQEALTNVFRHAKAKTAHMRLAVTSTEIRLTIADDGIGIPANRGARQKGVGLDNIRSRVREFGGTLSLRRLKRGCQVTVAIPRQIAFDTVQPLSIAS